ncbi:carboxymuconolactone decarboxylase family protein [Streptomyces sp. NPDC006512]|uniref:carboxymuconolactone decarboxylase family protein n=1 Tax=Streptomyces sp. NPDC006512 TaxID=3154307 RepID=UPI0033BB81E9
MTMTNATASRVNFAALAPKAFKALVGFDTAAREGLDPALVELIQIRSSQLNGCAFCLHVHVGDARKAGEDDLRLHLVASWREAGQCFSAREQAALALTEAVTLISVDGVPDEVYARAAAAFDDTELAHVLAAACSVNTWNRVAVSTAKGAGADVRR